MKWGLMPVVVSVFTYAQTFLETPNLSSWIIGEIGEECIHTAAVQVSAPFRG